MDNGHLEGTQDQFVTYPSVDSLGNNVHVSCYGCIRKYPQRYDPVFVSAIDLKSDSVASLVFMTRNGDYDINIDVVNILSFLDKWYAEYFMDVSFTLHIREFYALKSQIHNPGTPIYMDALSC